MYRVVIIDQELKVAQAIKKLNIWQTQEDFKLISVASSEEHAVESLIAMKADIVFMVTDHREVEKIALIRQIQVLLPDIILVLISDNKSYEQVRAGFLAGAFDYLLKPLSEEQFGHALTRIYETIGKHYAGKNLLLKIDALIENIFLGGGNTEFICESILEQIYSSWENDPINGQMIAEQTKEKIYEKLIKRKPWLEKFIYDKSYTHQLGFRIKSKVSVIKEWKRDFSLAANVVKKYQMLDFKLIYHIGKYVVVHVDEQLNLEKISKGVYLNPSYISHVFKKVAGMNFVHFITDVKIDRAKILLIDEERKIADVAATIGYNDAEYFSKVFKQKTGMSPTVYRKSLKT